MCSKKHHISLGKKLNIGIMNSVPQCISTCKEQRNTMYLEVNSKAQVYSVINVSLLAM